jgi:SAM-dependent methyltransferase
VSTVRDSHPNEVEAAIRRQYGAVAQSGLSSGQPGVQAVAQAFGYTAEELLSIPSAANMGLSCGNPTAFAGLRPGEVVVDLGCGGGLDVFLAAQRVGPTGKAIGIDMTPEMIALARANLARHAADGSAGNIEFHLATIDDLPLPSGSVDCIISNCVINLAPDKPRVFREMARVLGPGGRLAISDIALKRPLPAELGESLPAYVGCIAGAIAIEEYHRGLAAAGFSDVQIVDSGADLNAYALVEGQSACCAPAVSGASGLPIASTGGGCCDSSAATSPLHAELQGLLARYDVNEYAASVRVYAIKAG